jgi:hypothetical protein
MEIAPIALIVLALVVLLLRVNALIGIGRQILANHKDIITRDRTDTELLRRLLQRLDRD